MIQTRNQFHESFSVYDINFSQKNSFKKRKHFGAVSDSDGFFLFFLFREKILYQYKFNWETRCYLFATNQTEWF